MEQRAGDVGEWCGAEQVSLTELLFLQILCQRQLVHWGEFVFYYTSEHVFYIKYGWCFRAARHIGLLIATAEQWKMIATAVPSAWVQEKKNISIVPSDLIQR